MKFDKFYSDPHFGHDKIIQYCKRPFKDVHHQTMSLMARYNLMVDPRDNVLWLGDCFFSHTDEEMALVLEQLHGTKTLVCGNHDKSSRRMAAVGFEFCVKQLVWQQDGRTFRGSHFPWKSMMSDKDNLTMRADQRYPNWHPKQNKDECLVHGHTHSPSRHNGGNAVHCGVDAWAYAPVPAEEVYSILESNGY